MINPHYLPNEKNGGVVPTMADTRHLHIMVGCGWCKECRRAIANNWRIRMLEEYKENNQAEFVNLSFSKDSIIKLEQEIHEKKYKGIKGDELDVNILAAYAIRMFTERWRKKYKKAPRHWFVTELGHKNSERIHLHGIMWNISNKPKEEFMQDIIDKWMYGNVTLGAYVDERTMNYITKYITKVDEYHTGYKQKTFVSKGIGKGYIERMSIWHQWREDKTNIHYLMNNGRKYALPKYYKNKLWTEEQRQQLWTYMLDKEQVWVDGVQYDKTQQDDMQYRKWFYAGLCGARQSNERARMGNNMTVNKKYIITEAMKMSYSELINYNKTKLVKCVARRKIDMIEEWDNSEDTQELNKSLFCNRVYLGEYVGTTTAAERKRNEEIAEARRLGISVRKLRLERKSKIKRQYCTKTN